jgi:hypothetical protein
MGLVRRWSALPALAALAGCGIVGPIYDPGLRGAPRMACAEVAPAADTPQCFRFERRRIGGERLEMNDGSLDGDTELLAFLTGGEGCADGDLHFAAVTGASDEPGQLSVLAFSGTGAQRGHDFQWREAFASRSFAFRGVGGPFVNATGLRIRAPEGGFQVQRVCLADYWRQDIWPLRASRRRP